MSPPNEDGRLASLRAFHVLDTPPEDAYDILTRLASSIAGTPIALISLVDAHRQWIKSKVGLDGVAETPRAFAFCDHAIRDDAVFEVTDARADARFADNPLVVDDPRIRFYAGAPLLTSAGDAVGTICVLDREPRSLTPAQREQLQLLARLVVDELERSKQLYSLTERLAHAATLTKAILASPRPESAVRALVDAVGRATGGTATLLRRAPDGTYGAIASLDARPMPGGRHIASGDGFALENAPDDELAFAVPGPGAHPELILAVRSGARRPDAGDRAALELVASSFAIAARNVALHAESERRRGELLEARATQAELVSLLARDVRGPVTSIVGFSRLLEEDARLPQDTREALAVVRASGERVAELAADIELLSRIELAAVEPQWRTVDLAALATAAGATVDRGANVRVVADPDLLAAALGRLVEDGRRAASPVRARLESWGEAVAIELSGTGSSPAGTDAAPTVGARLTSRIVERHGGTLRTGAADGAWWIRLTLPTDARQIERGVRVLLAASGDGTKEVREQLLGLGFTVETVASAAAVRDALRSQAIEVLIAPVALTAWNGIDRLSPDLRRRLGLIALVTGGEAPGNDWDAVVSVPALTTELRAAVYTAAGKARVRRSAQARVTAAR